MKKHLIKKDLKHSTAALLDLLYKIPEDDFNKPTRQKGWTIGKVAEHLIKVETGTVRLFTGSVKATERDPEEKIPTIRDRMMDFDTKLKAYEPIIPDDKPKDKTKALEKLQDIHQKMAGFIELQDLTETLTGFEHPLFGLLTRIEWIYFNIYHSERHGRQIKKIEWELGSL